MIFNYDPPGTASERMTVDLRNDLVRFNVRGEPIMASIDDPLTGWHQKTTPGPVAVMTMPAAEVIRLATQLLKVPPVEEMRGKVPFVVWFDTTGQRDEFVRRCQETNPNLTEVDLSFFPT